MIFVYGRDGCSDCEQTRKLFDKLKIGYEYIDIDDVSAGLNVKMLTKQYQSLPIVVVDPGSKFQSWCGFKYDRIKALKATHEGDV